MSGEFNPDDDDPMELPPAPDAPPNAAPASNHSRSAVLPSSASPAGVSSPIAEADEPQSGRGRSDTKESDKSTGAAGAGAGVPPVPILPVLNGTAASSTSTSGTGGKPALPPVPAGKAGGPPKIDTKSSHPSGDSGSGSVSPANITAGSPPSTSGKLPLPPTPNSASASANNLSRQSSMPSPTQEPGHRRVDSKDAAAATKSPGLPSARSDRKSGDPPAGQQQLPAAARPSGGAAVKPAGATAATPTGPKTAIKVNLQNYSGYITLPLAKNESTFGFAKRVIENAKRKKIALPAGESPSNYMFLTVKTGQHLAESTFSANFDPTAKLIDVVMVDSESAQAKAAKPFEGKYAGSGDETPASPTAGAVPPGSPPQGAAPELSAAEKAKREKELRNQLIKEAMRAEMEANEKEEKARAEQDLKDRQRREKLAAERAVVEAIPDVPVPRDAMAAKVQQIRLRVARDKRLAEWLAKQDGGDAAAAAAAAATAAAGAGAGTNGADHGAAKSPALSPAASPASPRLDGKTLTPADAKAAAAALSLDGKEAASTKHQRTHTTIAGFMEGRARAIELLKKGVYLMKMTRQNENANSKKPYKRLIFLSPSQDRVIWAESRDDIRGFVMCCDVKQVIPNPDDPKGLIIQSSDDPLELQVIPPEQTRDQYLTIFKNIFGK